MLLGPNNSLDTDRKLLLAFSVMCGGMLFYKIWSAGLDSFLLVPTIDFPFESMEEFYKYTNKKVKYYT